MLWMVLEWYDCCLEWVRNRFLVHMYNNKNAGTAAAGDELYSRI